MDDLEGHLRARPVRGAFRRPHDPVEERLDLFDVGVTDVIVDLGEVRNHVRSGAAGSDHVMDPGVGMDVLTHEVDHVVHRLDAVQRGPAPPRRRRRMTRHPGEPELRRLVRQRRGGRGGVPIPGVPVEHDVHIVEQPLPNQVHLPGPALLSRCPVDPERPRGSRLLQPRPNRGRGGGGPGPEEVVAARVARARRGELDSLGGAPLRDPR